MWIAELREPSKFWTHVALAGCGGVFLRHHLGWRACLFEHRKLMKNIKLNMGVALSRKENACDFSIKRERSLSLFTFSFSFLLYWRRAKERENWGWDFSLDLSLVSKKRALSVCYVYETSNLRRSKCKGGLWIWMKKHHHFEKHTNSFGFWLHLFSRVLPLSFLIF